MNNGWTPRDVPYGYTSCMGRDFVDATRPWGRDFHHRAGMRTRFMSKHQIIDQIREHNPSAEPNFLNSFDEPDLRAYLDRLTRLNGRRGPNSIWVRQANDGPDATSRRCA